MGVESRRVVARPVESKALVCHGNLGRTEAGGPTLSDVSETEVTAGAEVSLGGGVLPVGAKFSASMTHRFAKRGGQALQPALEALGGEDALNQRLAANEELDALAVRAVTAAAESASAAKRRLLAKVVKAAVLDDAKIDEANLITGVLNQIDTSHIRCLEAIYRAEEDSRGRDHMVTSPRRAQRPLMSQVRETAGKYPSALVQQLERLGLLDGDVTWDGDTTVTGLTAFGAQVLEDLHASED